ncbi:MAG: IclR family transcriptional regulator [Thermocrispum agreste]|uniref:Glycerol operon regulatory protein n=1 Tax=Thermocrispum agreste TaxID=37925 RepID=A0A2W4JI14_9PSEU|nr:MAG: IclR family transcriptional regulator [Thermocrispum agreste]
MGNSPHDREAGVVQSVDRAIAILELLASAGEAGITEIAEHLGVHKSTASRLVATLQARELVEQHGERGRFTLGIGVLRFTGALGRQSEIVRVGTPLCEELADKLGESVHIAVLDGADVINICEARGPAAVSTQNWIGQRTPPHTSSGGKVLLAAASRAQQDEILSKELEAVAPRTITDPRRLREELERVRRDGYAVAIEEFEPGLHGVAVPVHGRGDAVIAAISASGPAYRMKRKQMREMVAELQVAARELSARLGHR